MERVRPAAPVAPWLGGKKHLHRYAVEFAFRYSNRVANGSNDAIRANLALNGVVGKRMLYRDSFGA